MAWLGGFVPAPMATGYLERSRGAAGALIGLLLTGLTCKLAGIHAPLLIPPMGASAVLLFAVPASPLAQPWAVVGGNTLAALIGVTCARLIPDPMLAAPVAAALAITAMFPLRCLHPPAGAVALTTVLGGPAVAAAGYQFVLTPVALNSALMLLSAIAFNNATRHPYPHRAKPPGHRTADRKPTERLGIHREDLDQVLLEYDQVLDISRDELENLYQQAELRAYRRRFGEVLCADIMSRDVLAVQYATPLHEAWHLLRRHDIRALPVIDKARRVVGLVSDTDFMASAELDHFDGIAARFRRLLQRPRDMFASQPEAVGQIMPRGTRTVAETMPIAELVPLMADAGLRHVAVVNAERRLSGIISQADLVAALYRGAASGRNVPGTKLASGASSSE